MQVKLSCKLYVGTPIFLQLKLITKFSLSTWIIYLFHWNFEKYVKLLHKAWLLSTARQSLILSPTSSIQRGRGRHHQSINSGWRYIFLGLKRKYNCASRTYFITNLMLLRQMLFQYCKHHIREKAKKLKK